MKQYPHRLHALALIALVLAFGCGAHCIAQRSPHRGINLGVIANTPWARMDSIWQMFQLQIPYLSQKPPVATTMPYPVIIGYLYADSVARTTRIDSISDHMSGWNSWNDTLALIASGLYQMMDWDPIRYAQYIIETDLGYRPQDSTHVFVDSTNTPVYVLPPVSSQYSCVLRPIESAVFRGVYKLWPVAQERKRCLAIMNSGWILRVTVDSIDSTLNTHSPEGYNIYSVYAHVADTLKGRVFPDWCSSRESYLLPSSRSVFGKPPGEQVQTIGPCHSIRFEYTPHLWATGKYGSESESWRYVADTVFLDGARNFRLLPGQEAIVFLRLQNHRFDDDFDYFDLGLARSSSAGILRIDGNTVYDPNRIWSTSGTLTYSEFLSLFESIKSTIVLH